MFAVFEAGFVALSLGFVALRPACKRAARAYHIITDTVVGGVRGDYSRGTEKYLQPSVQLVSLM